MTLATFLVGFLAGVAATSFLAFALLFAAMMRDPDAGTRDQRADAYAARLRAGGR